MSHCEDQYLWWSVALRWPVWAHTEPLARYRQHSESALVTLMVSHGQVTRATRTFLELIAADISTVVPEHPVLPQLADRIAALPTAD